MSTPPLTDDDGTQGWWDGNFPGGTIDRADGPSFLCLIDGVAHLDWRADGNIVREIYMGANTPRLWEKERHG